MNTHEQVVEGGCTNQPPWFPKPRTNHDPKARSRGPQSSALCSRGLAASSVGRQAGRGADEHRYAARRRHRV
jgi:hypothetical protein